MKKIFASSFGLIVNPHKYKHKEGMKITYIIWIAIFHIAGRKKIHVYCLVMTLLFFGCSQLIMSQGYIGGVVIGCIVGVFIAGTAGLKELDR